MGEAGGPLQLFRLPLCLRLRLPQAHLRQPLAQAPRTEFQIRLRLLHTRLIPELRVHLELQLELEDEHEGSERSGF